MIITRRSAFLAALVLASCGPAANEDAAAIEALMRATWDRPDAPLDIGPIAISSEHAVAGWTQGEMGGRALLTKHEGQWRVLLCAGDGIRSADGLISVGVPETQAHALATRLAEQEQRANPQRLAAMSRFEGVVRMDGH
ncbi:MAG: copper uptake system-associated protein [Terricaulis sp.]